MLGQCGAKVTPEQVRAEVNKDVSAIKSGVPQPDDIVQVVNSEIDSSIGDLKALEGREDTTVAEIEQQIEKELQQMLPSLTFDDRLSSVCKFATETLRRYDTVDNCLREVQGNEAAKEMIKSVLMDDPTYKCLSGAHSETQFDTCFRDFFSRKPHYLLRLFPLVPKTSTTAEDNGSSGSKKPVTAAPRSALDDLCDAVFESSERHFSDNVCSTGKCCFARHAKADHPFSV